MSISDGPLGIYFEIFADKFGIERTVDFGFTGEMR
jgi:hypothetical protein